MKINNTLGFSVAALGFLALGYFGVQYFGRNNIFTIVAAVGGAGDISYVLQKPSQPEAPTAPIKAQGKKDMIVGNSAYLVFHKTFHETVSTVASMFQPAYTGKRHGHSVKRET